MFWVDESVDSKPFIQVIAYFYFSIPHTYLKTSIAISLIRSILSVLILMAIP